MLTRIQTSKLESGRIRETKLGRADGEGEMSEKPSSPSEESSRLIDPAKEVDKPT